MRSASSASSLHFHFFSTYSFLVHGRSESRIRSRWRWRCPAASAWWPSDSRASEWSVSPWPRCGQSCTLIRLGSVAGSSLFFAPLVFTFSPALSVLWAPRGSRGWASPGGYIGLQQLYSRLFTGKPAGWGPHDNKGLTPHSSSVSIEIWLWRERGWMTGGRTLLPGEMRRVGSVPLWRAGGRSQGTARQTGGGFCSCMASGTYLVPEQPRAH